MQYFAILCNFVQNCAILFIFSVSYDFDLEEFDCISEVMRVTPLHSTVLRCQAAQNFISGLLRKNVAGRMTAAQCLEQVEYSVKC